jgi:hypothetical protein
MKIECLASGSTGNCYLVHLGNNCIILDAGIPIKEITKKVNLNDVSLAFISHNHKDHSASILDLALRGILVWEGKNYQEFVKMPKTRRFDTDTTMYCFPVEHGECKNGGFILQHKNECLLYITDFNICKWNLENFKFTHVMVECNYCEKLIDNKEDIKVRRQINTHMGLEGLQIFLDSLDLSKAQEIILMHQSQSLGDSVVMGATIYNKYKIKTGVCRQWGGIDYYG